MGKRKLYRFSDDIIKFLDQTIPENKDKSIDIPGHELICYFCLIWFSVYLNLSKVYHL